MTSMHNIPYILLFTAIATGVMQASLDKAGIGRVENTASSAITNILVILSIPITVLSNIGLIVITVWSFFELPWLTTLGVVAVSFIGFSLIWGTFQASIRSSENWSKIIAIGLPLVFILRLLCAASVVYLAFNYLYSS